MFQDHVYPRYNLLRVVLDKNRKWSFSTVRQVKATELIKDTAQLTSHQASSYAKFERDCYGTASLHIREVVSYGDWRVFFLSVSRAHTPPTPGAIQPHIIHQS
jgi:hypothetical protein